MLELASLVPAPAIPIWDQYVDFLKWALDGIAGYVGSGGIAIIIFTVIVRTLILPVTVRSIRSMKSMQDLQPKMAELKKKYAKDRVKLQEETMALYRTYGVNPVAGCLPLLLQLPIFLGVYSAISSLSRSDSGEWAGGFLWLDSLRSPDPLYILPILAGVFQLVQNQMSRSADQTKATDPQQAMMNTMLNIFPIFTVIFGWTFISGAVLYWVAQSIYGIVQQWFITGWGRLNLWIPNLPELPEHRRLGYHPPRDLDTFDAASAPPAKQGPLGRWWAKQMEQAQAAAQRQREATAGAGGGRTATATNGSPTSSTRTVTKSTAARVSEASAKQPRPYKRDSPKGRMIREQIRQANGGELIEEEVEPATASASSPNGANPARKRPRRGR